MSNFFKKGDICLVDLPQCGKYCLYGTHACVITGRTGSNYTVIPIKSDRGDLHRGEYLIEKGRCGCNRNSKLILAQERPVSGELVIKKLKGKADRDILIAISNYKKQEAYKIENIL